MSHLIFPQGWFYGYDVVLELIFAIITFAVSFYSFKIYNLTYQRQPKLFGIGFAFISASYLIRAIVSFVIAYEVKEGINVISDLRELVILNNFGIYSYLLLFVTGLFFLTYLTFKVKNKKIFTLIYLITISSIIVSLNKLELFYLFSTIFLAYIFIHYLENYESHKQKRTFLILLSFFLLFLSSIQFFFSVGNTLDYAISHILELIAYLLILLDLLLVSKNESKKK